MARLTSFFYRLESRGLRKVLFLICPLHSLPVLINIEIKNPEEMKSQHLSIVNCTIFSRHMLLHNSLKFEQLFHGL